MSTKIERYLAEHSAELAYLTTDRETGEDTGYLAVPCSPYGRNGRECAQVAVVLAGILDSATGEATGEDGLEYAMGLVVNGHDDVAYTLREYAGEVGLSWRLIREQLL